MRPVLGLALVLLLGGCATVQETLNDMGLDTSMLGEFGSTAQDAKTALLGPDQQEERLIGEQAAATLLGAAPLLADAQAQTYVNTVGRWIASNSDRPDLDWRFGILDTAHVGAFAAPGGYVFVTRGLLLELRDETELAGVLAHEISHVVDKHHLKALKNQAGLRLIKQFQPDLDTMGKLADGAKELYGHGLDRHQEYRADQQGAVLAQKSGYDPYGLMAALQTLDSLNPDDSRLALMFDTHPRPADRVARLDGALDGLQAGSYSSGAKRYRQNLVALAR